VRFGVVGDPVLHSRSPAIHNAAFEALGLSASFELLPTAQENFDVVARALRSGELSGVSVTMPHKDNAFSAVDDMAGTAVRSRSVNTIVSDRGHLHGYNTDIEGVRYAFGRLNISMASPVLVLGYGGAARAALIGLEGSHAISLTGRDLSRAYQCVSAVDVDANVVAWGTAIPGAVVVNATPLGMDGEDLPEGLVDMAAGLLDMAYGHGSTPATRAAARRGIPNADGLDMLVGQAVAAFELFTGVLPDREIMERAARGM